MQTPVQITFRGIEASPTVDDYVRRRAMKLETFFDRITRCHVTIEAPHHRRRHGEPFRVRVEVVVPGAHLVAGDGHRTDPVRHDLYAAIDDVFEDAGRLLLDYAERRRCDIKVHEVA